ncbi:hypothetical protein A4X13_0g8584, partial [Tilletia indica]
PSLSVASSLESTAASARYSWSTSSLLTGHPPPSTSRVLVALALHLKFRSASLPPYRGLPPLPPQVLAGPAPHLPQVQVGVTPSLLSTVPTGCPSTSSSGRRHSLPPGHRSYRMPFHLKSAGLPPCLPATLSSTASVLVASIPTTSSPGRSPSSPTATPISSLGRPPSLPSPGARSRWLKCAGRPPYLPTYLPTSSSGRPPSLPRLGMRSRQLKTWPPSPRLPRVAFLASPSSPRLPRLAFLAFLDSSSSASSPSPLRLARRPPVP